MFQFQSTYNTEQYTFTVEKGIIEKITWSMGTLGTGTSLVWSLWLICRGGGLWEGGWFWVNRWRGGVEGRLGDWHGELFLLTSGDPDGGGSQGRDGLATLGTGPAVSLGFAIREPMRGDPDGSQGGAIAGTLDTGWSQPGGKAAPLMPIIGELVGSQGGADNDDGLTTTDEPLSQLRPPLQPPPNRLSSLLSPPEWIISKHKQSVKGYSIFFYIF